MNLKFTMEEGRNIIEALATTARGTYYGFFLGTFLFVGAFVLDFFNFKLFGWGQWLTLIGMYIAAYYVWNPIAGWKTWKHILSLPEEERPAAALSAVAYIRPMWMNVLRMGLIIIFFTGFRFPILWQQWTSLPLLIGLILYGGIVFLISFFIGKYSYKSRSMRLNQQRAILLQYQAALEN